MPGPTKDRLAPRIQDTARILWSVYVLFTLVEILLLLLGGVDFFDAVCHAFATLATGAWCGPAIEARHFEAVLQPPTLWYALYGVLAAYVLSLSQPTRIAGN